MRQENFREGVGGLIQVRVDGSFEEVVVAGIVVDPAEDRPNGVFFQSPVQCRIDS